VVEQAVEDGGGDDVVGEDGSLSICNDCLKHQKITSVILDHAFDLKLSIRKNEQHFNQATHEYRAPVEEIVLIGCVDLFGDTPARSPDRPREFGAARAANQNVPQY
jgi:hypothetical protein